MQSLQLTNPHKWTRPKLYNSVGRCGSGVAAMEMAVEKGASAAAEKGAMSYAGVNRFAYVLPGMLIYEQHDVDELTRAIAT